MYALSDAEICKIFGLRSDKDVLGWATGSRTGAVMNELVSVVDLALHNGSMWFGVRSLYGH